MIGKLSGRLEYRSLDHLMIDVGGVGYIVYCSERTMAALPGVGAAVSLYTDLLVREDLMQLFGFLSLVEKEWHRMLTSVQGVGAKVSLAILGALGPEGVGQAIALGDWNTVKAAKGVGPKLAQRIVLDLKDKAPAVMAMGGALTDAMQGVARPVPDTSDVVEVPKPVSAGNASVQAGALSALSNLGYAPAEAAGAVAQASGMVPDADEAGLIGAALKLLAPKG